LERLFRQLLARSERPDLVVAAVLARDAKHRHHPRSPPGRRRRHSYWTAAAGCLFLRGAPPRDLRAAGAVRRSRKARSGVLSTNASLERSWNAHLFYVRLPGLRERAIPRRRLRLWFGAERFWNAFAVGWRRVYGSAGNRGRRRHAGGITSSLRHCPGAGSRPHADKWGMAWLGHDGVCLEASRAVHITLIERRVLPPDLNLRSHCANGLPTPLTSDFCRPLQQGVFMFPLRAFWFCLCPCPASAT
jgi:hypothetical protein